MGLTRFRPWSCRYQRSVPRTQRALVNPSLVTDTCRQRIGSRGLTRHDVPPLTPDRWAGATTSGSTRTGPTVGHLGKLQAVWVAEVVWPRSTAPEIIRWPTHVEPRVAGSRDPGSTPGSSTRTAHIHVLKRPAATSARSRTSQARVTHAPPTGHQGPRGEDGRPPTHRKGVSERVPSSEPITYHGASTPCGTRRPRQHRRGLRRSPAAPDRVHGLHRVHTDPYAGLGAPDGDVAPDRWPG